MCYAEHILLDSDHSLRLIYYPSYHSHPRSPDEMARTRRDVSSSNFLNDNTRTPYYLLYPRRLVVTIILFRRPILFSFSRYMEDYTLSFHFHKLVPPLFSFSPSSYAFSMMGDVI